ncbi:MULTISPECIES: GNAT family N-acetyltransferase [unclassified Pseudomonas]|uniref:GNAT family N-acetyltransferase n=1 Tax=unclassified Pseudomonas TaxID=196821 RepID=UPI000D6FD7E3|nr:MULTISPECIES: GNAT family N-acetyltransferase [unclassified Pseudomonas]MED5612041.1 GNAT family N-acetyltransferase [Pseudomonas sp. JH-2]PWU31598.1 GNAT family N-acetyltransferase [Pseudomonas sp. RW407]
MNFPRELQSQRLILRPMHLDDADALFSMMSDPQVMRYWNTPPWTSPQQAVDSLQRDLAGYADGSCLTLALTRRENAAFLGTCTLHTFSGDSRRAELGYCLARHAQGQGYMNEALRTLLDHAFGDMRLNRLEADIDPRNQASAATLERLGFQREGLLRQRWIVAGEVSDSALYGLLTKDWAQTRAQNL